MAQIPHDRPGIDLVILREITGYAADLAEEGQIQTHALVAFTRTGSGKDDEMPAHGLRTSMLANLQYDLGISPQDIELVW